LKEFIDLTPEGNAMPFESPRYPNGPSAGNVASDQAAAVLRGLPAAVTSIPGVAQELGAATYEMMTGHGSRRMGDLVTGAVRGVADPVITATKGAAALVAPSAIHGPSPEEWERAAEGAGAQLVAAELPNAAAGLGVAGRWAGRKITSAKAMEARAAANTSKAVAPTTLEGRATMQRIAPAAAEERLPGLRGAKIDRSIREGLGGARQNLQRVEQRLSAEVRPEFQIAMDEPLTELNSALKKLQKRPDLHADAIRELELVKAEFERLPRFASFNDVLELRRDLDAWIEQAGGFRNASSAADRTAMRARRGGANLLRKALNSIDPEFAAANRRFSLYQSLDDIVARREVGDVGKVSPALPGRGNILDDILATWAGNAVGGQLGGAALEGLNLAAQSRGWANARSGFQMRLAEILRKTPVERKLLPPGAPRLTTPDNSGVSSARASVAPATREIRTGRLLGSGARQAAAQRARSSIVLACSSTERCRICAFNLVLSCCNAADMACPFVLYAARLTPRPLTSWRASAMETSTRSRISAQRSWVFSTPGLNCSTRGSSVEKIAQMPFL